MPRFFEYYIDRLKINKKGLIRFLVFLGIVLFVTIGSTFFNAQLSKAAVIFFIVTFSVLCVIIWAIAGHFVFKSLFVVSGGLSLMIFLAQSYCNLPDVSRTADGALQSIFGFSLIYLGFIFLKDVFKETTGGLKTLGEIYGGKKPWLIVSLGALFVGLFLWQLYEVVRPIVFGLCIYK